MRIVILIRSNHRKDKMLSQTNEDCRVSLTGSETDLRADLS